MELFSLSPPGPDLRAAVSPRAGGAPQNAEETGEGPRAGRGRGAGGAPPLGVALGAPCPGGSLHGAELLAPAWRGGGGTEGVVSRPALLRAESTVDPWGDALRGSPCPPQEAQSSQEVGGDWQSGPQGQAGPQQPHGETWPVRSLRGHTGEQMWPGASAHSTRRSHEPRPAPPSPGCILERMGRTGTKGSLLP